MAISNCKNCSKNFYVKPAHLKSGKGLYCSLSCKYKGTRTGKLVSCSQCGVLVYKKKTELNRSKSKKYFCSKSCQFKWRNRNFIGEKHTNWKHGKFTYRGILERSNVPKVCRLCKTTDKRVLAVHHIDHNHENNVFENLAWLCHNCHHLVHHYKQERARFMAVVV
ncbi:MAG: hypothetical protein COV34_00390 [Candidatus Zambryskibacteria bacterium CG10_big_fil_rev_8_21_14_0_10_42_12]|uniref:HNH nuclease domain-containing protein n=1 Tax=Candidatus Zambryskibacteria bacterium CG10_big_fil_rev_8_21_14_0_10_42_12 TaxID=1975115 RepID=A0A2H0QY80_9BACT|nr:MAG: hypothetical protein COV34_00390 [Candidatus Zambryskibacteria bacterium CG10_big_fil_rev_8_21_14_0_10_42_12]